MSDASDAEIALFRDRFNENISSGLKTPTRTKSGCHEDDIESPEPTYALFSQGMSSAFTSTPISRRSPKQATQDRVQNSKIWQFEPEKKKKKTKVVFKSLKERRKTKFDSFSLYIHRVHKYVNPTLKISEKAMNNMESFIHDMFERIAKNAEGLKNKAGKKTITAADIKTATTLALPNEIAKYANEFARQRLKQYDDYGLTK
uniref:Histone domain-containing protein n=1 Tax=Panagrellus redivivus TaxID=6233 RepID=A0A7E4VJK4_PANRE